MDTNARPTDSEGLNGLAAALTGPSNGPPPDAHAQHGGNKSAAPQQASGNVPPAQQEPPAGTPPEGVLQSSTDPSAKSIQAIVEAALKPLSDKLAAVEQTNAKREEERRALDAREDYIRELEQIDKLYLPREIMRAMLPATTDRNALMKRANDLSQMMHTHVRKMIETEEIKIDQDGRLRWHPRVVNGDPGPGITPMQLYASGMGAKPITPAQEFASALGASSKTSGRSSSTFNPR